MKQTKLIQKQIQELNEVIRKGKSSGPEVRRAQTILLVDQGVDSDAITAVTNFSRRHAFTLRRRYLHIGISAIQDKRQGKPKELLTRKQRDEIVKTIKTLHFPRAAPEENPQEHVWKDGRSKISHNRYIQNIDTTTDEFVDYLNKTEFHYSFLGLNISAVL